MHCYKISLFSQLKTNTSRQVKLEDVFRSSLGNNTPVTLSQMQLP